MTAIRPAESITIDVVFDLACPWCFIGKRQIERALRLRPRVATRVRWWPFLLNPDVPAGGLDHTAYLVRKFGSRARSTRICKAIEEVGGDIGIPFAFGRVRRTPNSLAAHRLVHFVSTAGGSASATIEALFTAYFVEGRDIGAEDVLVDVGQKMGFDRARLVSYLSGSADASVILMRNAHAHRLGINGVPAFIFAGGYTICGAQEANVLARMLDVARESAAVLASVSVEANRVFTPVAPASERR